jgi:hypothetical protein
MGCRRVLATALGATLVWGLALVVPNAAVADVAKAPPVPPELHGTNVTPSQTGGTGHYEWLGSYQVNGKQVWCVNYLYKAPRGNERYRPGEVLRTKWNTPIPADRAADISYLLLRHGNTTSDTEATALAHILHSWTASAQGAHPTRNAPARQLAYDAMFHRDTMPANVRTTVDQFTKEAAANRGPWTAELTAPAEEQTIGTPANWSIKVVNAKGSGVADVPVTFTATGGTLSEAVTDDQARDEQADNKQAPGEQPGDEQAAQARPDPAENVDKSTVDTNTSDVATSDITTSGTSTKDTSTEDATTTDGQPATPVDTQPAEPTLMVNTDENGVAEVAVAPDTEAPKISASFESPNQTPVVQQPLREDVQKVVLTGGEQKITEITTGTAKAPVGDVKVTKLDAETSKPIPGASVRITGADREGAALKRDGGKLLGADGEPGVVKTGEDGTATIQNLKAPQEICVVETVAPAGYEKEFDKKDAPSACGTVDEGKVLALTLKNKPNEQVPITIPAGGNAAVANAAMLTAPRIGALLGFGVLLLAAGLGTVLLRRRTAERR